MEGSATKIILNKSTVFVKNWRIRQNTSQSRPPPFYFLVRIVHIMFTVSGNRRACCRRIRRRHYHDGRRSQLQPSAQEGPSSFPLAQWSPTRRQPIPIREPLQEVEKAARQVALPIAVAGPSTRRRQRGALQVPRAGAGEGRVGNK